MVHLRHCGFRSCKNHRRFVEDGVRQSGFTDLGMPTSWRELGAEDGGCFLMPAYGLFPANLWLRFPSGRPASIRPNKQIDFLVLLKQLFDSAFAPGNGQVSQQIRQGEYISLNTNACRLPYQKHNRDRISPNR